MKLKSLLCTLIPGLALSPLASALVMNFDHGGGSYSAAGVTATATAGNGALHYSAGENAIGVKQGPMDSGALDNGVFGARESLAVSFDQTISLNSISFRQWENSSGWLDSVTLNDSSGGALTFTDSGQSLFDLLDTFATGAIELDSFELLPNTRATFVYLHSIDFDLLASGPVEDGEPAAPSGPETTEVSAPQTGWLLGAGMVGLGLVRLWRSGPA